MEDDEARAHGSEKQKETFAFEVDLTRINSSCCSIGFSRGVIYIYSLGPGISCPIPGLVIRKPKKKKKKEEEEKGGVKEKGKNYRKNSVPKVVIF